MKPLRSVKKCLSDELTFKAGSELKKDLWTEIQALQKEAKPVPPAIPWSAHWRLIMKAKRLELTSVALVVVAAAIAVQVFLGIGSGTNAAWGQVVTELEKSHGAYLQQLSSAVKAGDLKTASHCADMLDEFWQKLGWLARAQSGPDARTKQQAIIDGVVAQSQEDSSDQIGLVLFTDAADQFLNWLEGIQDKSWIAETEYVCKQLEEYAEEMRDAGRDTDLGLAYIEHCLPNFLAYARWFNELPWQHPEQPRSAQSLLTAVKRDLDVAAGELRNYKTRSFHRFAARSLEQVQENLKALHPRLAAESVEVTAILSQAEESLNQLKQVTQLGLEIAQAKRIKESLKLLKQVSQLGIEIAQAKHVEESLKLLKQVSRLGIEISQANQVDLEDGISRALQTKTDNGKTLGSDLQQGIRKLSDQCDDLVKRLDPSG